jgi:chemotaxis signal transduction protein
LLVVIAVIGVTRIDELQKLVNNVIDELNVIGRSHRNMLILKNDEATRAEQAKLLNARAKMTALFGALDKLSYREKGKAALAAMCEGGKPFLEVSLKLIEYGGLSTVPMMPPSILGVINLRGAVVPVMDLSARFGRLACSVTKRTCIVIAEIGDTDLGEPQVIGMVVDVVNAVIDIAAADIKPPPAFGNNMRTDFIAGMSKVNQRFVIMLNASPVLTLAQRRSTSRRT